MFEILLSLVFLIFLVFLIGVIASRYIFQNNTLSLEFYEIGFIGIIFLTFITFLVHFFFPLSAFNNLLMFIILISVLFFDKLKNLKKLNKSDLKLIFLSLLVVLIMTLNYNPNEDYGYYHLPYIINMISDKIVFGLSNIQVNFAWNSSWLNFTSILNLPILGIKGTQLSNSILYFFVLIFLLKETLKIKRINNFSNFFILTSTFYLVIKFSRVSEHGFDFPANIFLIFTFYYFLKLFDEKDINLIKKYFILIMLFSTFSLTIKLSTFLAPILVIPSFGLLLKKKIKLNFLSIPFIFCSIFIIIWLTQQFIYSGCLVPFFEFTCFKSFSWYNPGITDAVNSATGAVNKSFSSYRGDLSSVEYVRNFNWVSTWFERNKSELSDHLIAYILPLLILILYNFKNFFLYNKNLSNNIYFSKEKNSLLLLTIIFFIIFGISIWFIKSPVIRFGIPYLLITVCFIFFSIFRLAIKNFIINKGIFAIIALVLIFNVSKNVKRIIDYEGQSYWPEVLVFKYSHNSKYGFKVNYPDSNDSYHKKKYCWSIPYICHMGGGEGLKFEKKQNYMIVSRERINNE